MSLKRNPKYIFLDTNILVYDFMARNLGYLRNNEPQELYLQTDLALKFIRKDKNFKTYTASFSIPRFVSLLAQRNVPQQEVLDELDRILLKNTIIGLSESLIQKTVNAVRDNALVADLEDAFQYNVCREGHCFYLLTANTRDFAGFTDIQIIHPKDHRTIEY